MKKFNEFMDLKEGPTYRLDKYNVDDVAFQMQKHRQLSGILDSLRTYLVHSSDDGEAVWQQIVQVLDQHGYEV